MADRSHLARFPICDSCRLGPKVQSPILVEFHSSSGASLVHHLLGRGITSWCSPVASRRCAVVCDWRPLHSPHQISVGGCQESDQSCPRSQAEGLGRPARKLGVGGRLQTGTPCPNGGRLGRTQTEHIESASPPKADVERTRREVRVGPIPAFATRSPPLHDRLCTA